MTIETLRQAIQARPFVPFTIRMTSGREVTVPHPEFIAFRGGRVAVVIGEDEVPHYVDLLLVEDLSMEPRPAPG